MGNMMMSTIELQARCHAEAWSWEMTEVGGGLFGAAIWGLSQSGPRMSSNSRGAVHQNKSAYYSCMVHLPYFVLYTFVAVEVAMFVVMSRKAMQMRAKGGIVVPTKLAERS
jgi:hypothetical protein